jgi:hypothetical protein
MVEEPLLAFFILHTSPATSTHRMQGRKTLRKSICLVFAVYRTICHSLPKAMLLLVILCVESEGGADLVGGLVELLGIKGGSETEGDAGAEENVVRDGCDTAVIDLDLLFILVYVSIQYL